MLFFAGQSVMVNFGKVKNVNPVDETEVTLELIYATDPSVVTSEVTLPGPQTIGSITDLDLPPFPVVLNVRVIEYSQKSPQFLQGMASAPF